MKIEVLTLFPEFAEQVVKVGIPRKAVEGGALAFHARDLRDYSDGADRRVDDRPYGGGPGMVMEPGPLSDAIAAAKTAIGAGAKVIAMSPQGVPMSQALMKQLSAEPGLILLCGRYEGLDERVTPQIDLEVSLGDFVLSGGELAAMVLVDAVARLLPGVLGHEGSADADSFSAGLLDHPHYTRPPLWREAPVPDVLLSGDHAKIARWRLKQALGATFLKRPDLIEKLDLSRTHAELLREFLSEHSGEKNQASK
ncbi:MAG: tRNA (guanosine(37)-N1)-methyltransferase TrmD [Gammaproteobacteria bacterium]|jgi:tRNA (guanine37-N1)-methyltransferase|nr:tRNA (guanosine(37)-N1)-methyltransferase TrmD [Gammaproteobacteria bacterium]